MLAQGDSLVDSVGVDIKHLSISLNHKGKEKLFFVLFVIQSFRTKDAHSRNT